MNIKVLKVEVMGEEEITEFKKNIIQEQIEILKKAGLTDSQIKDLLEDVKNQKR